MRALGYDSPCFMPLAVADTAELGDNDDMIKRLTIADHFTQWRQYLASVLAATFRTTVLKPLRSET